MELSTAIGIINKSPILKKADGILILANAVKRDHFFSTDFVCQSLIDNYDPIENKKDRGSISANISNLIGAGLLSRHLPPFDPGERLIFSRELLEGVLINEGPRKTKFVFQITPKGSNVAEKNLINLTGASDGTPAVNDSIHPSAQFI